jgi:hypothetical protein
MPVPEHTPDATPPRTGLLRRISFAATAVALTGTFAFALSGIASTEGTLRPDGQAAALAGQDATRSEPVRHRECRRGGRHSRGAADGRV